MQYIVIAWKIDSNRSNIWNIRQPTQTEMFQLKVSVRYIIYLYVFLIIYSYVYRLIFSTCIMYIL